MLKYLAIIALIVVGIIASFVPNQDRDEPPSRRPRAAGGSSSRHAPGPLPSELRGRASVIDGDTIDIAGQRIRLYGIDAPERAQTCVRNTLPWSCGLDASAALTGLVRNRELRCESRDRDRYQRIVAVCWLNDVDVNRWLVSEGWAVAYRQYATAYVAAEASAQQRRRGMWAGTFQQPEEYRRRNR
jgi:endonuclease YncB( thermonuclease family)